MKFLKQESTKKSLGQQHKDYLGMDIPKDYFTKSKKDILKQITDTEETKKPLFRFRSFYLYPIAASLILLIGLTFWMQNNTQRINPEVADIETRQFKLETDDSLLASLFIEDSKMDEFLDAYILNEIIVETDNAERSLDAILINSFFVKDSLIDDYFEENILHNVLL